MISEKKLLFCNVDFDTDLASVRSPRQQQSCFEAQFYYLLCGGDEDRIFLDADPHEKYQSYLSDQGIPVPRRCSNSDILSDSIAFPWGWSTSAINRFLNFGAKVHHPPLNIIKTVNGRSFCHRTTQQHGLDIAGSRICKSAEEARALFRTCRSFPLVIKPEHGNSGIGFIHVPSTDQAADDTIDALFSQPDTAAVIQPWVIRVADFSSLFQLTSKGGVRSISHHRTLNNRAGVYYGNLLIPDDPLIAKWRDSLDAGAAIVARELHDTGYFGPVGLDWIVYTEDETGREKCALIDINARQPMSFVAYCLREQLASDKHCLFQFAPRRNYRALTDYGSWYRGCARNAFDAERRTGILLFTPLSYAMGPVEYSPVRHGF
ncbi:MAG: hypothetical protein JXR49_17270, partial [Acidobacteria bacterium]|nr:hypothetical protein [Acidobacteriota bacterium]